MTVFGNCLQVVLEMFLAVARAVTGCCGVFVRLA